MSTQESLTYLHSLSCLNLCFNRKLLSIPRSTPTFKLALILLLSGDLSLNPGPVVRHNVRLATTNIRSIREKTASLTDLIISKTIDILAVTETWLRPHDTASCIADISPPGYVFRHKPQVEVVVLVFLFQNSFSGHFIWIYRPPGHPANFLEQLQDLLENVVTIHSDFYIVGDVNLHLDTPSATTTTFNDILASFDTTQHVNFPIHIHGHWFDIIITRSSCKNIQTPTVVDGLSDHNTVIANFKVRTAPAVSKHNVFYRAFHSINIAAFMGDITTSNLVKHPTERLSELYKQYHQILKTLLHKQVPIKTKSVSQKPPAP